MGDEKGMEVFLVGFVERGRGEVRKSVGGEEFDLPLRGSARR